MTMTQFDPTIDAVFREYANLELRCHHLLLEGKEDSVEIAEAENRMDELWTKLDDVQHRSLNGMASDLNWIRRKGEQPPKGRQTPEDVPEPELQELWAAIKTKEWHRILHYLRLCAPVFLPSSLARERGIAYDAIGFQDYAGAFNAKIVEFAKTTAGLDGPNCARYVGAPAIGFAPVSGVLVWRENGVKATTPAQDRSFGQVEYTAA